MKTEIDIIDLTEIHGLYVVVIRDNKANVSMFDTKKDTICEDLTDFLHEHLDAPHQTLNIPPETIKKWMENPDVRTVTVTIEEFNERYPDGFKPGPLEDEIEDLEP